MGGEEGCGCGGVGDGGGVGEESVDGGSGEAAMGGRVGSGCDLRTDTEKKQTNVVNICNALAVNNLGRY